MSSVADKIIAGASGNQPGSEPFDYLVQVAQSYGRTLDISDVDNISIEDSWYVAGSNWYQPGCTAVDREKGLLFVVNGTVQNKLTVLDISDPTDVTILSYNSQTSSSFTNSNGIVINPTTQRIYILSSSTYRKLTSYQYSDAGVITYKSQYNFGSTVTPGGIAIDTEDDRLYVAAKHSSATAGLGRHYEFDISTPDTFTSIGSPSSNTFADTDPIRSTSSSHLAGYESRSEFDMDTKILYGSRPNSNKVTAVDVSTNGIYSNENMTLRDTVDASPYMSTKAATMDFNDKLYFVVSNLRVSCIDVSDPDNLTLTDTLENLKAGRNTSTVMYGLKVDPARKLLFQASRFNSHTINGATVYRLNIIDYSDPTDLTLAATFDTPYVAPQQGEHGYRLELF